MSAAEPNHDPALSAENGPGSSSTAGPSSNGARPAVDTSPIQLEDLDSSQIMSLLRHLPEVFTKLAEQGGLKDSDAARTLSNLSQSTISSQQLPQIAHQLSQATFTNNDPGPSSHPRGPPNLGQLSAVASQSPPISSVRMKPMKPMNQPHAQEQDDGGSDGDDMHDSKDGQQSPPPSSGKRNARSATMGTEEWSRQRKDNHKEVERRRRGNINEGINELGRIVPNGSGEKAKGAILSRAVQYIHHLKDNEARNIEKWTLEKLLMDQAMGDLQAQLEEMRRAWDEERVARQKAQSELEAFKSGRGNAKTSHVRSRSPKTKGEERDEDDEDEEEEEEEEDVEMSDTRAVKRQRVE